MICNTQKLNLTIKESKINFTVWYVFHDYSVSDNKIIFEFFWVKIVFFTYHLCHFSHYNIVFMILPNSFETYKDSSIFYNNLIGKNVKERFERILWFQYIRSVSIIFSNLKKNKCKKIKNNMHNWIKD